MQLPRAISPFLFTRALPSLKPLPPRRMMAHVDLSGHTTSTLQEQSEWASVLAKPEENRSDDDAPAVPFQHTSSTWGQRLGTPGTDPSHTKHTQEQVEWESALIKQDRKQLFCAVVAGSHSLGFLLKDSKGRELARHYHDTMLASSSALKSPGTPFSQESLASTAAALADFARVLEMHMAQAGLAMGSCRISLVGTAAFRRATDEGNRAAAEALLDLSSVLSGFGQLEVDVLSGAEEGNLAFQAAVADCPPGELCAVIDLGGRSTEIAVGRAGAHASPRILSMELGCIQPSGTDMQQLSAKSAELQAFLGAECSDRPQLVLAGGTATTAAALLLGLDHYDGAAVHNTRISAIELTELAECVRRANDAGALSWCRGQDASSHVSLGWLSDSRRHSLPLGCERLAEIMVSVSGVAQTEGDVHAIVSDRDLMDAVVMRQQEEQDS